MGDGGLCPETALSGLGLLSLRNKLEQGWNGERCGAGMVRGVGME